MRNLNLLLLLMLLSFAWKPAAAQNGTSMANAFVVPVSACGTKEYVDYRNNGSGFTNNYGSSSPDIWYRMVLTENTDVSISLCGSDFDTYLYVLDELGNAVVYNDDNGPLCTGTKSSLNANLAQGTYYVVTEGYSNYTGNIALSLITKGNGALLPGANMSNAINAGTYNGSGNYTDTRSNASPCLGDDIGNPSFDIYYKFTLTNTSEVILSHCGSGFDTYMHLLDSYGTLINSNDDNSLLVCPGSQAYIQTTLPAGTYYVVSEGYSSYSGNIMTSISVATASASQPVISYTSPPSLVIGTAVSFTPVNTGGAVSSGQTTSTFVGSGSSGSSNGTGTVASFSNPISAAVDAAGNLYVADAGNHTIRKVSPAGVVTSLAGAGYAGYADGTGSSAVFRHPTYLAVDAGGNVFVSDQQNHRIRKITPSGVVSTFAGSGSIGSANGTGTAASFQYPMGLAFSGAGDLYVADAYNHKIRKISPSGVVTTFAGTGTAGAADGAALSAQLNYPMGLTFDNAGNLYIGDRSNYKVRKISGGVVSTLAGNGSAGSANGTGSAASFNRPNSVAVDATGNTYVADDNNNMIRKITSTGLVTTFAGTTSAGTVNGEGAAVRFYAPYSLVMNATGIIYVVENTTNVIRKVVINKGYTISPQLPAGLVFNNTDGTISGTPTVLSPLTVYTIVAYNSSGSSTTTISFAVIPVPPVIPRQNYIFTYTPRIAITNVNLLPPSITADVNKSVQYFDGLGRIMQSVEIEASPSHKDVIQPVTYDEFGREVIKYLPYTSALGTVGSYRSDAVVGNMSTGYFGSYYGAQREFYQANGAQNYTPTSFPFSEMRYERSPLNRVAEQGFPGITWQPVHEWNPTSARNAGDGRSVLTEYLFNNTSIDYATDGYAVRRWRADALTGAGETHKQNLSSDGYYAGGELSLTVIKDENWELTDGKAGTVEEYKDKDGRVILKRTFNRIVLNGSIQVLSTFYVYDYLGNLAFVLPPAARGDEESSASMLVEESSLNNYCYQYRYDTKNRLIEKKIPGKEWEFTIYNAIDQVVLSQDPNQRNLGQWMYSKYDKFGRPVTSGIYSSTSDRSTLQALVTVDGQTNSLWESRAVNADYSNLAFPRSGTDAYTFNYYDDYTFPEGTTYTFPAGSTLTKGLQTGSKVKVLGTTTMLLSLNFYDEFGKVLKSFAQNYLSGGQDVSNYDEVLNVYSFSGELKETTRIHHVLTAQTTIANQFTYDHVGRKLLTKSNINNVGEVVLSRLNYNEVGQLLKKELHSTDGINFLQSSLYAYNERGWLKESKSNEFSMELKYENGTIPQYNGNISNQYWGASGINPNIFNYKYDKLNRLIDGSRTNALMSEVLSYDVMGNIKTLSRDGGTVGDYQYSGNRLIQITGGPLATGIYSYDSNGNAVVDGRTGVTLTYNNLNLPATAVKAGLNLTYAYDASGTKLRKISNGVIRSYVSGIEYDSGTIDIIHTPEGIARSNAGVYSYEYNLTDHLGNVRYSFSKDINGSVKRLQSDDYYAFGKRKSSGSPISLNNKYLYNGKEMQDELSSLNEDGQLDYGARFYDPVIGRWNVIDPLAELSRRYSPYTYGNNNPIRFVDPDGMMTKDANGNIHSDNAEEAQSMFRQLQSQFSSQNQDDPKKKEEKKEQGYTPVPQDYKKKGLPGFPGSKLLPSKKGARPSWDLGGLKPKGAGKDAPKIPKGTWGEWDSQHGEVEVYNKSGEHQGAWNPESGEENEGKQRDDRKPTYNRYQSTEPDANQIIKTLAPLDGQQGVPFRNYNLPIIVKPNPIIIIGGAVGTIIIGGWILIGG